MESEQKSAFIPPRNAERVLFFTDAVVAIALTLLVLPLMESVATASEHHMSTGEYLAEHAQQLFTFWLSFAVIGVFWSTHYRQWHGVERMDRWLFLLNFTWLLCIVWLPVATSMVGAMKIDQIQALVYIGPMLVATIASGCAAAILDRHPEYRDPETVVAGGRGLSTHVTLVILYVVALGLTLIWPGTGYAAMFVLLFFGPLQRLVTRVLRQRR